jgi:hypothetical protein
MTVIVAADGNVELKGSCPVEDAEVLLRHLLGKPDAAITWEGCEWAHTAVIQVLLIAKRVPVGSPGSPFLRDRVGALLKQAAL